MSEVPNLIDYWAAKSSSGQAISVETSLTEEHIIHNDCMDDAIIEHLVSSFGTITGRVRWMESRRLTSSCGIS